MQDDFVAKDGRCVRITVDDADYTAIVHALPGGELIGRMEFSERESADRQLSYLHLTWAHMNLLDGSWTRQGIGRRCIQLVWDVSGMTITAGDQDEQPAADGSQLTGDAPGFVSGMRAEGLIASN